MRFRDLPIERKITLTILPVCLVPALVFLILMVMGTRLTFEEAMGSELRRNAADVAEQFNLFLIGRISRLDEFAELLGDDPALLIEAVREEQLADAVALNGSTGEEAMLLAATEEGELLLEQMSSETGALTALPGNRELDPGGVLIDRRVYVSAEDQTIKLLAWFRPHESGGRLIFYFDAEKLLQQFYRQLSHPPDLLIVYSASGFPVFTSRAVELAKLDQIRPRLQDPGGVGWFPLSTERSKLLMAGATPKLMYPAPGGGAAAVWTFLLQYDMEFFLGPQDSLIWLSVLIALGLILLLFGFGSLAARMLVTPIQKLRQQVEIVTQGNLDARVSLPGHDEIGHLAESFNTMTARLRSTYRSLEERLEENRLHAEHIHVINEIGNAILQALSVERIFEILHRDLQRLLSFDAIWIGMLERNQQDLRITHIQPPGLVALFDHGKIPGHRSLHARVVSTRETVHVEIGPQHRAEFFETRIFNSEGFQSYLIAPLPSREGILGTLTIASTEPDAYNSELAAIMTSLAQAVAIAMEQAAMFQQVSHFAGELELKVAERTNELKTATQKLILTEKYYATGRMAGNLSHEINNPLGIIKNYLQLVRNSLRESGGGRRRSDPNIQHLDIINEEVNRIARLVRQLLDLHRPVEQKIEPVDLNGLIREMLDLMQETMQRNGIEVDLQLDPELPRPLASHDLLRQVLINLIRNAQDAMETDGGTLTLRTSSVSEWSNGEEHQFVRIRVQDTGCGICAEHLSQVFDPFFSTKPPEKGSGLGLCVSYSIVRMYQGTIDVVSQPGEGTSVLITLPILDRAATGEGAATGSPREDFGSVRLW